MITFLECFKIIQIIFMNMYVLKKKSHKDETGIEYVTSNCKVTVSGHVNLKITLEYK